MCVNVWTELTPLLNPGCVEPEPTRKFNPNGATESTCNDANGAEVHV